MSILLRCCAVLLVAAALSSADDRIAGLHFSDGIARSAADFSGQHVLLYYHCGHCPTAMGSLGTAAKAVADWIEQNHKPAWLITITPDLEPGAIADLLKEKGLGGALGANDPANVEKISLNNILQMRLIGPDGALRVGDMRDPKSSLMTAAEAKPGTFHIPVQGLTDAKVIAAWWMVERGSGKGALKELTTVAKKKGALQEQAQLVIDAAQKACDTAFAAVGDGMPAYESIERLLTRFDGLDPKLLKARLAELAKDAKVKDELKARDMWQKCQAMMATGKPKDQAAGRDGLAQLAKKMPDTVYGKKAAAEPPPKP